MTVEALLLTVEVDVVDANVSQQHEFAFRSVL